MATKKAPKPAGEPAKTEKKQGNKFKPGRSGNPKGRPEGSRNKATLMLAALMEEEAGEITRKVVELAKGGDLTAAKLILDRVVAPRKDRPVQIALPGIKVPQDAVRAMAEINNAVSEGHITPSEAQALGGVIDGYRKILETTELEQRISNLEESARLK